MRIKRALLLIIVTLTMFELGLPAVAQEQTPPEPGWRPDAPALARAGSYAVGTREFVIENADRSLPLTVWYPALNPDNAEQTTEYNVDVGGIAVVVTGRALRDAAPDLADAPYPLVIYTHEFAGNRGEATYLTEHLASRGFVVFAVDHTGSTSMTLRRNLAVYGLYESFAERLQDISSEIDYATALTSPGGALEALIDADRVALIGRGFEAFGALVPGGAQINPEAQAAWCADLMARQTEAVQNDRLDPYAWDLLLTGTTCNHAAEGWSVLAAQVGLAEQPQGLWQPLGDLRVDAVISLDGVLAMYGADGAAGIHVPTLLVLAGASQYETDFEAEGFFTNMGAPSKLMVTLDDATATIFGDAYDRYPGRVSSDRNFWGIMSDPIWDMDRAHDLINGFVTGFLGVTLQGRVRMAQQIDPSRVYYPGVTIIAEGF